MSRIAFIPMRSGSKRVIGKNLVQFADRPLAYWAIKAAYSATSIDEVVIAVDKPFVHRVWEVIKLIDPDAPNITVYARSDKSARDGAYTEDVLLEWINEEYTAPEISDDRIMLVQVTNPFLTAEDVDGAFERYETGDAESILSCAELSRFVWKSNANGSVSAANYNPYERRRSQDFEGETNEYLIENGSFYLNQVQNIWRAKNRLSGRIEAFRMPEYTVTEIDTNTDVLVAELLFREEFHHDGQ